MKLMLLITVLIQASGGIMYALADAADAPVLIAAGRYCVAPTPLG